ncbi:MAG: hypothetical protein AABZ60_10965, partial [Planctomycetota bacterium]
ATNSSNSSLSNTMVPIEKKFSGSGDLENEPKETEETEKPEEDPRLFEERNQIRATQAKATFQVYTKSFGEEQELIEHLLDQYGLTLENIREFPEAYLENLSKEQLDLLSKYQNQGSNINSARQQVALYEKIFATRFNEIRKYRKEFLDRVKSWPTEIECALLEKLSDPFLSEAFYQEVLVLLGMAGLNHAFDTLGFLFENEKHPSKQICLFRTMLNLDPQKAITFLFKIFEGPTGIDVESAKNNIYGVVTPGMEEFLASFLASKIPLVSQTAYEALLRINSLEAIEFLNRYEKENLKKQDHKKIKSELLKKLQNKDLSQLEHQKTIFKLCVLTAPDSFSEIEELFLQETNIEKRLNWFAPILKLNKLKAIPLLIQSIDSKNELELTSSRELVIKVMGPGLENYLEPLLKKSPELSEFARSILLQIDSPLARKMLKPIKTPK